MRAPTGTFIAARVAAPTAPSAVDAVPRLEALHRQLERGIEEFRLRDACDAEIARDLEPPAQDRHTQVGHARLERRTLGQLRPAAVRRDTAVLAQLLAPASIPHVLGTNLDEGLDDAAGVERPDQELARVGCARRSRRIIPLRAELDRIDLAAVQMKERERHRIGREQLEIGLLRGLEPGCGPKLGPQRLESRVVVVRGIEPVEFHVAQRRDQVIKPRAVRPGRGELPLLEDRCDGVGEDDVFAPDREVLRITQLVDPWRGSPPTAH